VQRINAAMLSRHISSVTDNGQRIGDHHSTSNVKDRNRPIEAVDAKLVVEWRRQGIVELAGVRVADAGNDLPQESQRAIDEWTTCETVPLAFQSTQQFLSQFDELHKDRYGLLVPRSSATHQKRKRAGRSGPGKTKRTVSD
jgi:predicted methyltransferase